MHELLRQAERYTQDASRNAGMLAVLFKKSQHTTLDSNTAKEIAERHKAIIDDMNAITKMFRPPVQDE